MRKSGNAQQQESEGAGKFPERLKQLRVQKSLSQVELAKVVGMSSIHISRYERGISKPTADKLSKLAEALEVSGDYLYFGIEKGAARVNLKDRKVLEIFKEIENLPEEDRSYILCVVSDLLTTRKIKAMTAQ